MIRKRIPDKKYFKSTTTTKLRNEIVQILITYNQPNYLEIGSCLGHTVFSVCEYTNKCTCIEINSNSVKTAMENLKKLQSTYPDLTCLNNIEFITGTANDLPGEEYHVVFIDASHKYEDVKRDYNFVLSKNKLEKFDIIFHDYGLVDAGVKKFIHETFPIEKIIKIGEEDNWNPIGTSDVNDNEAVVITIRKGELQI